jgi:hypothetical protein
MATDGYSRIVQKKNLQMTLAEGLGATSPRTVRADSECGGGR